MLLSEAILAGAAQTRPIHGRLYLYSDGVVEGTCAIGAALLTQNNGRSKPLCYHDFARVFPSWDHVVVSRCPAGCPWPHGNKRGIMGAISHIYDQHLWCREAIAAWVATMESKAQVATA
jgi:hypothetical protein